MLTILMPLCRQMHRKLESLKSGLRYCPCEYRIAYIKQQYYKTYPHHPGSVKHQASHDILDTKLLTSYLSF
jgi:hypothetical protein